jgi:glycosyltransferase involved in cell wall biosynthesis
MPSTLNSKKIIKIGIDGGDFVPFSRVKSGIQRIVDSFLREVGKLKNNNFIFNYYYFSPSPVGWRNLHPTGVLTGVLTYKSLPQKLFAYLFLPFYFRKNKNDVFLGFSGYLPKAINLLKTKKIIFLYDLGFLKFPQFYDRPRWLVNNTLEVITNANKIIVLSDYAKKELVDKISYIDGRKIVCIYPGVDHLAGKNLIYQLIKFDYFLYVGVIKPIKKIEKLFEIFYYFLTRAKNKDYRLILIGQKEEKYFKKLLRNHYYLKLKEKIVFKSGLSDRELARYYLQSTALLNFSYEEGFCFPVLEALSLGKTAIVNNLPIYQEFKDKFDNLLIGKNDKEIVQFMCQAAVDTGGEFKYQNLKDTPVFKWVDFTKNLLRTIESL